MSYIAFGEKNNLTLTHSDVYTPSLEVEFAELDSYEYEALLNKDNNPYKLMDFWVEDRKLQSDYKSAEDLFYTILNELKERYSSNLDRKRRAISKDLEELKQRILFEFAMGSDVEKLREEYKSKELELESLSSDEFDKIYKNVTSERTKKKLFRDLEQKIKKFIDIETKNAKDDVPNIFSHLDDWSKMDVLSQIRINTIKEFLSEKFKLNNN